MFSSCSSDLFELLSFELSSLVALLSPLQAIRTNDIAKMIATRLMHFFIVSFSPFLVFKTISLYVSYHSNICFYLCILFLLFLYYYILFIILFFFSLYVV